MSYNISTGIFENEFELNSLITNNANAIQLIEIINNEQQVLIDNSVSNILDIETCNVNQQVLITALQSEILDVQTCNVNQQNFIDSFDSDLTNIETCNITQQNEIDTLQTDVSAIKTCNITQQNEIDILTANLSNINYDIDLLTTDDILEGTNKYSQWTETGNNIYYTTGNVGIGIATPAAKLHVSGHLRIDGSVDITHFNLGTNQDVYIRTGTNNADSKIIIADNNTNIYVGIGTRFPTAKLDVVGDINCSGKYKIYGTPIDTDDVLEGTNKYYSDSLVESYLGSYNIFLDHLEHPDNAMTTYTEHGYTVSASSKLSTSWVAYKAFDKISNSGASAWISGNNTYYDLGNGNYQGNKFIIDTDSIQHDGEWLKIRLPNAKIIKYCDVYPRANGTAPKSGVILASNDDTNWVHLSSFTDKTYLSNQATRIDINSTRVYEYYMILIETTDGGRTFTAIGEIKFFEPNLFNNGSIYTTGYVGIGTTDPKTILNIVKAGDPRLRITGLDGLGFRSAGIQLLENTNDALSFGTELVYDGDNNKFNINMFAGSPQTVLTILRANGYVGIGTTDPITNLHVKEKAYIGTDVYVSSSFGPPTFSELGGQGSRLILFKGTTTEVPYCIGIENYTLWYASPYTHKWYNNTNISMTLDENGNLGIGTTTPKSKLHCQGEILSATDGDNYDDEKTNIYFCRGDSSGPLTDRHHYITSRTAGNGFSSGNFLNFYIDDGTTTNGTSHNKTLSITGNGVDISGSLTLTGPIYNDYQSRSFGSGTKWIRIGEYYQRCNCKFTAHYAGIGVHDLLEIEVKWRFGKEANGECLTFKTCNSFLGTSDYFSDIYIQNFETGYGNRRYIWVKYTTSESYSLTFYTHLKRYNQFSDQEAKLDDLTTYQAAQPTGGTNFTIQSGVIQTVNYNHEITAGNLTIDGNVGIGTTDPYSKLDVRNGQLYLGNTDNINGTDNNVKIILNTQSTYSNTWSSGGKIVWVGHNRNISTNTTAFIDCTNPLGLYEDQGSLSFGTSSGAGAAVERMIINNYGDVGIGSTDPQEKLDVLGNARFKSSYQVFISTAGGGPYISGGLNSYNEYFQIGAYSSINNFDNNNSRPLAIKYNGSEISRFNGDGLTMSSGDLIFPNNSSLLAAPTKSTYGGNGTRIVFWSGSSGSVPYALGMDGGTLWYSSPQTHKFYTQNTLSMIIASDGKVGIGDASPEYKLDVNGDFQCTRLVCNGDIKILGNDKKLHILDWRIYQAPPNIDYNNFPWGGLSQRDLIFSYQPYNVMGDYGLSWLAFDDIYSDQLDFTGQHRSVVKNKNLYDTKYVGYIVSVSSNGEYKDLNSKYKNKNRNIRINSGLPYVDLSNKEEDKACFGVISSHEEHNDRTYHGAGRFKSSYKIDKSDARIIINSIGEGAIWISNYNGNIENGDYLTSSDIPGIAMRQNSEFLANYTVAKATCSVDFNNIQSYPLEKVKQEYIYTSNIKVVESNIEIIEPLSNLVHYSNVDENSNMVITSNYEFYSNVIKTETINVSNLDITSNLENCLDSNGDLIYEIQYDDNSNIIYEPEYDFKYIKLDGTIIDYNEYDSNVDFKMCFIGCTYHCG